MTDKEFLDFLKEQGKEIETYKLPSGQIIHSVGKLNIKALVKVTLAQLS